MGSIRGNQYLVSGDTTDPFLPKLISAINGASEIDLAVAFIKATGLLLIHDALRDALLSGARLRVLTGDYLCATDPEALRSLLILAEDGAEVRVFESDNISFHMKAYIFIDRNSPDGKSGHAFVGSSNISKTALSHGLEWNVRIEQSENPAHFQQLREQFDYLFSSIKALPLTNFWIQEYSNRVAIARRARIEVAGANEMLPPPTPNEIQVEALDALRESREAGNSKGLVVLATGLGKTWLSAFDARAMNAKRLLFVAHREEILSQAEETFVRIWPNASVGKYTGKVQDLNVDLLFASIQTLGKITHLSNFPRDYFDYIVVDEFHHAAARTYRQLLSHFVPRFLLGLTATPDRTDQGDILALCENNLVISRNLFRGVELKLLCPFRYFGIADDTVDYANIPWRSGRFDPTSLDNALATTGRASHVLKTWREMRLSQTLAFCASQRHADYMADYFVRHGERAVSVHANSDLHRSASLEMLQEGSIDIIFSVDLFNEGVDVPSIDTVLMIRPTESKILFLQQLGRGFRTSLESEKEHLVVLDFIGNHLSFFRKVEALFGVEMTNKDRRRFLDDLEKGKVPLPEGCYLNYDLKAIEFLKSLAQTQSSSHEDIYRSLLVTLGRRPTLLEFYRADGSINAIRQEYGGWFPFVVEQGDLSNEELACVQECGKRFAEIETVRVEPLHIATLEAFAEGIDNLSEMTLDRLAQRTYELTSSRRWLGSGIPPQFRSATGDYSDIRTHWQEFWSENGMPTWLVGKVGAAKRSLLRVSESNQVIVNPELSPMLHVVFAEMLLELCDYKYLLCEQRVTLDPELAPVASHASIEVPYFPDLGIACGHFATSEHDETLLEYRSLPERFGRLNPSRHFIATARGNSMNGGKSPIHDGDLLLLELITPSSAGSISEHVVAIERQDVSGDDQYLLRQVKKSSSGQYVLRAWNPDYEDMIATEDMRTFARLKGVIDPLEAALHRSFLREEIPPLFGLEFNRGLWHVGHVHLKGTKKHILLVTLSKRGRVSEYRYHDYFMSKHLFHWQSQGKTTPAMSKGVAIVNQERIGAEFHLFVRKHRLQTNLGAPFYYCGPVKYREHQGAAPMNVTWELQTPLAEDLAREFDITTRNAR